MKIAAGQADMGEDHELGNANENSNMRTLKFPDYLLMQTSKTIYLFMYECHP